MTNRQMSVMLGVLAMAGMLIAPTAWALGTISYNQTIDPAAPTHVDATDYSPAGLNIGQDGYLFFNFDGSPDSGEDPVGEDRADTLPSWIVPDYDPNSPDYSFGDDFGFEAFSRGGVTTWNFLTLPDGTNGLSGALVDPRADNNSNNTIKNLAIGPNAPPAFWLHYVTDNTNMEHDSVNRLRARAEDTLGADTDIRLENLSFNGTADVYSILYTGWVEGDIIKLQLNSGVAGESPSIAGLMVDAVPEPTSLALVSIGVLGLGCIRRRR